MFGFFKNKKKNCDLLQNWHIPVDATYRSINNPDSLQFANADESCVLYFSPLAYTCNQLFSPETFAKMNVSVIKTENGWELKGAKHANNEVLICVFTYTNEDHENRMRNLFESISYASSSTY